MGEGPFPFCNPAEAAAGGVLAERVVVDYTGDGTNNRDIDLGMECDAVRIVPRTGYSDGSNHVTLAYADGTVYGCYYNGSSFKVGHASMASADGYIQGIQAGTDNVRLGTSGSSPYGPNVNAALYTAIGYRFSS